MLVTLMNRSFLVVEHRPIPPISDFYRCYFWTGWQALAIQI